jgi:capsular exopolysaccharide synthesis family protein
MHQPKAIPTRLIDASPPQSFGFAHFYRLLLSKAWLIMFFCVLSLLAAVIYLKLAPKLYESCIVVEVESKSGQTKLTQPQSALEGELLERRANLTKAEADRDSALAELQADERLAQRGLISALEFKKAQIAATELSANYEVEKQRYDAQRINNVQSFDIGDKGEPDVNLDENIKTVEQAIVSDTLLLGVLKSNGLEKDPSFAPPNKDGSVYLDSELVARFRSRVKAEVRSGTRLIDISVKDTDPKRAQQLAQAIVKAFIDQNTERFHANDGLPQEADRLKAKLQDAEQAVQKYRQDHGSVSLGDNQKALDAIAYNALVREVEADRALYESVVTRMKVTDMADGISGKNIRVVATPLVASKPVEPEPLKILLLAFLAGAGLGCALVIICDMADHSIRSVDQAERISGVSVLATVPESKRRNRKKESVLTTDPASYEAEAFRTLRTVIALLGQYAGHKTLLFTSANPHEGKSYCSLNFSVALAQVGLRTLLIDADIRRPQLSKIAVAEAQAPGLTDCLAGQAKVTDCYKPTGIENLFVLPAGQKRSSPSELFAGCDFVSLLDELGHHFDRIVLDSAPINAVSDTQLIAGYVQAICFVVRAVKTPEAAITRACALLGQGGVSPIGIVFNRMPTRSHDSYYYSEYAGGYANGRGTKLKLRAKLPKPRR